MKLLVFNSLILCLLTYVCLGSENSVLELNEKILDHKDEGSWLIEFYAPWCGHCRQLEPAYEATARVLSQSDIRVAKIDATRYTSVAAEFQIRGFPTIIFIQGKRQYVHRGERTSEALVEFARRAYGPVLRGVRSVNEFEQVKKHHKNDVYFMYIGERRSSVNVYMDYSKVADRLAIQSFFYSADTSSIPENIKLKNVNSIVVFKDDTYFEYEDVSADDSIADAPEAKEAADDDDEVFSANQIRLMQWIQAEKFSLFAKMAAYSLNELSSLKKKIVIVSLDKNASKDSKNSIFKDKMKKIAKDSHQKYHAELQFILMSEIETVSMITMQKLVAPSMLVLDPIDHSYFMMSDNYTTSADQPLWDVNSDDIVRFLDDVLQGRIQAQGGSGIIQRVKRLIYDIHSTIQSIFEQSIWLALLVFGIPSCIIGIICYALCGMQINEDDESYKDDSDEDENENEEESIITPSDRGDGLTQRSNRKLRD